MQFSWQKWFASDLFQNDLFFGSSSESIQQDWDCHYVLGCLWDPSAQSALWILSGVVDFCFYGSVWGLVLLWAVLYFSAAPGKITQCLPPQLSLRVLPWHFLCVIFLPCLLLSQSFSQELSFGCHLTNVLLDALGFIQDTHQTCPFSFLLVYHFSVLDLVWKLRYIVLSFQVFTSAALGLFLASSLYR